MNPGQHQHPEYVPQSYGVSDTDHRIMIELSDIRKELWKIRIVMEEMVKAIRHD